MANTEKKDARMSNGKGEATPKTLRETAEETRQVIAITLESGLELAIDRAATNDMELLDDLVAADRKDALAISRIYDRVLTRDQKKRLYDTLRDPATGRVTVESAFKALGEIFEKIGEAGKN